MAWHPAQYLQFEGHRQRPALDLLFRIDLEGAREVVDLGCGTGNITRILAERWPDARVVGVDSSPEMLERARRDDQGRCRFEQADLASWQPSHARPDLLFSNAALHWLDHHEILFPRLLSLVAQGGILAVQMPHNHQAPSHTAMIEAASAGPWAERVMPVLRPSPVHPPERYFDLLEEQATSLDLWETEYTHVLPAGDEHPVVAWTRGTALRPLIDAAQSDADAFVAAYTERIYAAYPLRPDGRVLFQFRRLFLVARLR